MTTPPTVTTLTTRLSSNPRTYFTHHLGSPHPPVFPSLSLALYLSLSLSLLQCRPSKGRKRGFCWCVDKYGHPLPGFDGKEKGDAQDFNSESQ